MFRVVEIDLEGLERLLSRDNLDRAQKILAEQVGADCNTHVPMETGTLRGSMDVKDDSVEWEAFNARGDSYAEYVYTMQGRVGHVNWTTPDTGSDWLETARAEHSDDWVRVTADALLEGV